MQIRVSNKSQNQLTPRQTEVLKYLAEGQINEDIADQLCVSKATIDAHRATIMNRIQIFDLAGLVKYAIVAGLISDPRK
jgi:DNA-binding NarL/FixJ family response regulator